MTYEEAKMQIQAIPEKIWDQLSEPDREAMEMAFSALQEQEAKAQLSAEGTTSDLISRQDAIKVIEEMQMPIMRSMFPEEQFVFKGMSEALSAIKDLPYAQPEIKPISYQDCANAMMMMWMADVLTDGEYRRIMDKLNDHESRKENR